LPWIHSQLCTIAQKNNELSSYCIGISQIPNQGVPSLALERPPNTDTTTTTTSPGSSTGHHTLRLDIQYDANPQEVAWMLVETNEDNIVDHVSYGEVTTPNEEVNLVYDNLPNGNYTFVVTDVSADGICCNAGSNGFILLSEIKLDGSSQLIWADNGDYGVGTLKSFELNTADQYSSSSTTVSRGRQQRKAGTEKNDLIVSGGTTTVVPP